MSQYQWPYENEVGREEEVTADVLVLGGGIAGCYAAIAAARKGLSVALVEKGATIRSGAAGSGIDHWESACTNPCSKVTPKEIAEAYVDEQDHYSNGIAHYIECREGYDRLLDMESFGGKIRDTEDEFKGAEFRDEETKLMFAYDYANRFTLRVWGTTFKPALFHELKRLGVRIFDRTEATALLLSEENGEKRGAGAVGMNVRTGKITVFHSRSTILAMSRPARIWLFHPDLPGLCEFRPPQSIGSGHAMGWRAGIEFTMMEKSVKGEFSASGRSFPPYAAGNNHNTWYAAHDGGRQRRGNSLCGQRRQGAFRRLRTVLSGKGTEIFPQGRCYRQSEVRVSWPGDTGFRRTDAQRVSASVLCGSQQDAGDGEARDLGHDGGRGRQDEDSCTSELHGARL